MGPRPSRVPDEFAGPAGQRRAPPATARRRGDAYGCGGDCLWNIAQRYLGDGSRYLEVYSLNQSVIDKGNEGTGNPKYTIYPGQVLKLPAA